MPLASRKSEVLEAALHVFAERGFEAATIADIRQASGASVGSIYHHFDDKAAIAAELYCECLADYHRGLSEALDAETDAEAGIRTMVAHHLRWVSRNRAQALFLLERSDAQAAALERVRGMNRVLFARVREWLSPHVRAGRIREMPLELLYDTVLGPSQEHARRRLRGNSSVGLGEARRALEDAAWNAVRNDPESKRRASR